MEILILQVVMIAAQMGLFLFIYIHHGKAKRLEELVSGLYTFGAQADLMPEAPKKPRKAAREEPQEKKVDVNEWLYGADEEDEV